MTQLSAKTGGGCTGRAAQSFLPIEAARNTGASRWRVMVEVILPLSERGVQRQKSQCADALFSERDRKFADSPLEEAVCCEPVSEMELGKVGFLGVRRQNGPFPRGWPI